MSAQAILLSSGGMKAVPVPVPAIFPTGAFARPLLERNAFFSLIGLGSAGWFRYTPATPTTAAAERPVTDPG